MQVTTLAFSTEPQLLLQSYQYHQYIKYKYIHI